MGWVLAKMVSLQYVAITLRVEDLSNQMNHGNTFCLIFTVLKKFLGKSSCIN